MAQHIMEAVINTGILNVREDTSKAEGLLAECALLGMPPTVPVGPIWDKCESSIELVMASALCCAKWPCRVAIEPQHRIGKYRLDFLVSGAGHKINVECDGKEYHHHDIPMEQWQADRMRDAFVKGEGIYVLRYTGTEIWIDAIGLASEVSAVLSNLIAEDAKDGD